MRYNNVIARLDLGNGFFDRDQLAEIWVGLPYKRLWLAEGWRRFAARLRRRRRRSGYNGNTGTHAQYLMASEAMDMPPPEAQSTKVSPRLSLPCATASWMTMGMQAEPV